MRLEKKSAALMLLAIGCATTSACGQHERPRTASDFCLADKRISAEPAPALNVDDPGNRFDTDATLGEILAHNEVHDRLCPALD